MSGSRFAPFGRIAIVNRGEPAMRLIHAVRDYNAEHHTDLRTIALYTEPDRRAMYVREADEAVSLGGATYTDIRDGSRKVSYLDYGRLERALLECRADAVWAGWGFVAEHAGFADLCHRHGIVFIGPSGDVMRRLGDKITSKRIAEQADVPVVPWSGGAVDTPGEAAAQAVRIGFPVLIKATAGGGGRGIRRVDSAEEVEAAFVSARSEALKAFGDGDVFVEKAVGAARHIEVQIVGDRVGTVWAVGVRDCTIQRRNQKVVEEAPSPVLTPEQDAEIRSAAARLGRAAGYHNAGTVEFLYEPATKQFYLMEVNARLQVEHPVTELTTGLDMVKLQIHVASGGLLEGEPPPTLGHAVEVRLNAEDPDNRFAPAPGAVALFRLPTGPGVRVDTGVEEGDTVAPEFDSMIAKVMAYGHDRNEALSRLDRALGEIAVVIRDGASNKAFLQSLIRHPDVASAEVDVGWLDRLMASDEALPAAYAEVAIVEAAVEAYEADLELQRAQFLASAARGRPRVPVTLGYSVDLRRQGQTYSCRVHRLSPRQFRVEVEGRRIDAVLDRFGRAERRLTIAGVSYRVLSVVQGITHNIEINGVPHKVSRDEGGVVRSPFPAVVTALAVKEGDSVGAGDRLATVEAMKMEMAITAEYPGTVRKVLVANNVQVPAGAPLLVVEPTAGGPVGPVRARVGFDALEDSSERLVHARCRHNLEELRRMLLGFDVDPTTVAALVAKDGLRCEDGSDTDIRALEDEILTIFVDVVSLFRREPADEGAPDTDSRRTSEEYLFDYLRDLDARGEGLPAGFLDKLRRALHHYGVDGLDRTTELEAALFRLSKSHNRMDGQLTPVLDVLERRAAPGVDVDRSREWRGLLDRITAEARGRYPAVHDAAREVRYQVFDRPFLERNRNQVFQAAAHDLAYLSEHPDAPDRRAVIDRLVACPQPLKAVLSAAFDGAGDAQHEVLLEVMTRRYYKIREFHDLRFVRADGRVYARAEYELDGKVIHLITSHAAYTELADTAAAARDLIDDVPTTDDVIIDFYLWRPGREMSADEVEEEVRATVNSVDLGRPLRRIVVAISHRQAGTGMSAIQHYTYRWSPDGYHEDRPYRTLHPMMGKRLEVWRLANFDIERLPSAEDVYLFKGVARTNPRDQRLFALAEVRDLTPEQDATGKLIGLPEFERMLNESLAAIRRYQAHRAPEDRLQWNRVLLYMWPPLDLHGHEVARLARKLAPATEGLGIEKVAVHASVPDPATGERKRSVLEFSNPTGGEVTLRIREPNKEPLEPLTPYTQNVVRLRSRGLMYPYELVRLLAPGREESRPGFPSGEFTEYDLDEAGDLVPIERPYGQNTANIVVGVIRNFTTRYPEGMKRVILLGDPTRGMGNLAEPECRRINAALDLAATMRVPLEWFAVSAGALISMESGTENMDWISAVLRKLIEFTQAGGEVNVVVTGINVGAQPYWNAEATMLMHTRGILVMMPESAMVLTGKQALDYSGGVSAEDNQGIGGYERIMGPNGQGQYFAKDISDACRVLLRHYEHAYIEPGERFPRRAPTTDPIDRDVRSFPHGGDFVTVGDVFSDTHNPERKRPFEIRRIMAAAVDQDHEPLERWFGMQDAEIAVVWDAHIGGYPVSLLGFESKPLPRFGFVPADGPDNWTSGTLFPISSKKVARTINSASGNRPLVVLANLSGFDGSPESMRKLQLEYGAEIGRSIVNFRGPIIFTVVSRYHGGAFVVFSNKLNENMEVAAIEGARASVIGGAPAAAVVFAREVKNRTNKDQRVEELNRQVADADPADKGRLRAQLARVTEAVYAEKLGEVADEFDEVHSVHRALEMGSVHRIIPAAELRPYLIDAIQRGIRKELAAVGLPR